MKSTRAYLADGHDNKLFPTARSAREAEFDKLVLDILGKVGARSNLECELAYLARALRGGVYPSATRAFITAAQYLERYRSVMTGDDPDPEEQSAIETALTQEPSRG